MRKLLRYFLMLVMTMCMYVPGMTSAEAAGMIVLPTIYNVDYPDLESTFYDNVVDCFKQQDKYEYVENDAVQAAIDKNTVKGQLPTKEALIAIAEEANADLVMCMQLDKLSYEPIPIATRDAMYMLELKGFTVSYDRETGKFKKQKLYIEDELDNGYYVRQNVPLRYWARTVQREMHRVMGNKKFHVQKQTIQKF